MKAKIVSDQHLEFHAAGGSYRKYFQAIHPADGERAAICIVAGDFDVISQRSRAFFSELCNRENHVLFVPGNHEYYGCKEMTAVDEALLEIEQNVPNLTVLRTGVPFHFAERRFLGDTRWLPKSPDLILSASLVNDSRLIPHVIEEAGARHQRFRDWLSHELRVSAMAALSFAGLCANTMPRSSRNARSWLITAVRREIKRSRTRWIPCRSS